MKILLLGEENEIAIDILIGLAGITSEPTIAAIHDHYVKGLKAASSAAINQVDKSNFNRACFLLEEKAGLIDAYNLTNGFGRVRDNFKKIKL